VNYADLNIITPTKSAPVFLPNANLQLISGTLWERSGNMSVQNNIGINVNVVCSAGFWAPQSLHRAAEEWKTISSAYPLFKLVQPVKLCHSQSCFSVGRSGRKVIQHVTGTLSKLTQMRLRTK